MFTVIISNCILAIKVSKKVEIKYISIHGHIANKLYGKIYCNPVSTFFLLFKLHG